MSSVLPGPYPRRSRHALLRGEDVGVVGVGIHDSFFAYCFPESRGGCGGGNQGTREEVEDRHAYEGAGQRCTQQISERFNTDGALHARDGWGQVGNQRPSPLAVRMRSSISLFFELGAQFIADFTLLFKFFGLNATLSCCTGSNSS